MIYWYTFQQFDFLIWSTIIKDHNINKNDKRQTDEVFWIDDCSFVDEMSHNRNVSDFGGNVKRRVSVKISSVDFGFVFNLTNVLQSFN